MQAEQIKQMIQAGLPGSEVEVKGDDDGSHFDAIVKYAGFASKPLLQQHRMVYQTLGDSMEEAIHALSIKTYTS